MATTELTGAEEVAWDLSDLYAWHRRPAHRRATSRGRGRRGGVPRALPRQGRRALARRSSPRRSTSTSGSSRSSRARSTSRTSIFSTNMADPARGALVAKLGEKARRRSRPSCSSSALEWAAVDGRAADALLADPALDHWRHCARLAPQVPAVPAQRAGGEDPHREDRLRRLGLVAALRGAARRAPRRRSTARSRRARDGDGAALLDRPRRAARGAAEAVTEALEPGLRTRTFIFNTILLDKSIDDRLRGYPTWITSRNLANETTDEAVQALIDAATSRYDVPQRYYRLKAKLLGLDRLEHYDRFAPVAEDASKTPWDDARERRRRCVRRLLARGRRRRRALLRRRLDRRAACGRTSGHGAFCATTVPGVHPYVLMNYTGDRRSILTLAHELGHGCTASLAQPLGLFNASTPLTTAETASVFGEALTFERLLAAEDDPRAAARPAHRAASRTRSRRRSGRSR